MSYLLTLPALVLLVKNGSFLKMVALLFNFFALSLSSQSLQSSNAQTCIPSESTITPGTYERICQTPIIDMAPGQYFGNREGGLYGNWSNEIPAGHLAQAQAAVAAITPLDTNGNPSPTGKIGFATLGMSNTEHAFELFEDRVNPDKGIYVNSSVSLVEGAQPGLGISRRWVSDIGGSGPLNLWYRFNLALAENNVNPDQLQVLWIKLTDGNPSDDPLVFADNLADDIETIVEYLKSTYPNLKIVFLSSRTYGGYAEGTLNPDDIGKEYAYASGFAVQSLILDQIAGNGINYSNAPVLVWGPYLWSDGIIPNGNGLAWYQQVLFPTHSHNDFRIGDGVHPLSKKDNPPISAGDLLGADKTAAILETFFKTHELSCPWFAHDPLSQCPTIVVPTAVLDSDVTSGFSPLLVNFSGSGSYDPEGEIVDYVWAFGDGDTEEGETVSHLYDVPGVYTATLTVTNDVGISDIVEVEITVFDPSPVASFITVPNSGVAPLLLTVDATTSYDNNGSIVSYSWDFGDGELGEGSIVQHTYAQPGLYQITLIVTDNEGLMNSITDVVNITAGEPIASFTAIPMNGDHDLVVAVDASGSIDNGTIVSYFWDFGDDSTASGITAQHTYLTAGVFTITLTVIDDVGLAGVATADVNVTDPTDFECPLKGQGDADCDGVVDSADFNEWNQEARGREPGISYDADGDGSPSDDADFNGDGVVDFTDRGLIHYT